MIGFQKYLDENSKKIDNLNKLKSIIDSDLEDVVMVLEQYSKDFKQLKDDNDDETLYEAKSNADAILKKVSKIVDDYKVIFNK
jgi:hypothetical protein